MAEQIPIAPVPKTFMIIGAVFCIIFTFLGLAYVFEGYIAGILVILVLVILVFLIRPLIKNKTMKIDNTSSKAPEYILLGVYFLIFCLIFPFNFHFIDVDLARKSELKKAGIDKLNTIKTMRDEYNKAVENKINSFKDSVDKSLDSYFLSPETQTKELLEKLLGKGSISFQEFERNARDSSAKATVQKQVKKGLKDKEDEKRAKYSLGKANTDFEAYYQIAFPVFENWQRFKVNYYYYDLDNAYKTLYDVAKSKMPDFEYAATLTSTDIYLSSPSKSLSNASFVKIIGVLLLTIVLHLCILAPYLAAERFKGAFDKNTGPYINTGSIKI